VQQKLELETALELVRRCERAAVCVPRDGVAPGQRRQWTECIQSRGSRSDDGPLGNDNPLGRLADVFAYSVELDARIPHSRRDYFGQIAPRERERFLDFIPRDTGGRGRG
jgi:hypothetical protein